MPVTTQLLVVHIEVPEFPADFIWGSAASSTQTEGAAPASDWLAWEAAGKAPPSRNGSGFWERYREDLALLAELGLDHHRLSIEWARIEPERGRRDQAAVDHYLDVIDAARDVGINIWVCLHHFTLPSWFTDAGGFLDKKSRETHWRGHLEFIAETFGDHVFGWQPINEPAAFTALGYLSGMGPPGLVDLSAFQDATKAIYLAWIDAWKALGGAGRPVATIHNLSPVFPADESSSADQMAASLFDQSLFGVPITAMRDGVLAVPGRPPEEVPGLAGSCDYFGFSYYSATAVSGATLGVDSMRPYPPDGRVGPMGYVPWPDGLGLVIERLASEIPEIPILVVENGIGTDDDEWRSDFLTASLATVAESIHRGADVRGYFHWTAVDNYEWLEGFDVKFGIIDGDRNIKASARVLADVAKRSRGVK